MHTHTFLTQPGQWEGKGQITLNFSSQVLPFSVKWDIQSTDEGVLCKQYVYIEHDTSPIENIYRISEYDGVHFNIDLSSAQIGEASGKGVCDDKTIAWEFVGAENRVQGFEVYQFLSKDHYHLHAEFSSSQIRTMIDGKISKI